MKKTILIWLATGGLAMADFVPIGVDTTTWLMKPLGTNATPPFTNYYNALGWAGVFQTGNSGGNFFLDLTNITVYVGQATPIRLTRVAGTANPATFNVSVSNSALAGISGGTSVYFAATSATTQTVDLAIIGVATGTTKLLVSATGYGGMSYDLLVSNAINPATVDSDWDGLTDAQESSVSASPFGRLTSPFHSGDVPCQGSRSTQTGQIKRHLVERGTYLFAVPEWTVEGWIYPTNYGSGNGPLVARYETTSQYNYLCGVTSNGYPYTGYHDVQSNFYSVTGVVAVSLDRWSHISASLGGTNDYALTLRVNGYPVAAQATRVQPTITTGDVWIGGPPSRGYGDNIRIWSKARTTDEIIANMWRTINTPSNEPNLLAEYRFDEVPDASMLSDYIINHAAPTETNTFIGINAGTSNTVSTSMYYYSTGYDDWNGNGLPNWFEEFFGVTDTYGDQDGDGVDNYTEFLVGTNPKQRDTDGDAIEDGDEDYDRDGLSNAGESLYGTRPDLPDTDDDGYLDGRDVRFSAGAGTNSRSPALSVPYSLIMTNSGAVATLPDLSEYKLSRNWTLLCRATFLQIPTNDCDLIARIVDGRQAYGLGMYTLTTTRTNTFPGVKFHDSSGARHVIISTNKLTPGIAYDIAAVRNDGTVSIQINSGSGSFPNWSENLDVEPSYSGLVASNFIGRNFNGVINAAYIGDTSLSVSQINAINAGGLAANSDWVFATDFTDGTNYVPVSSNAAWTSGHVENYSSRYPMDWTNAWRHAGDLAGGAWRGVYGERVEYVTALNADGDYSTGNAITCRVHFASPVSYVFGSPILNMGVYGSAAPYASYITASGFPTQDLLFAYTVGAADISREVDYAGTDSLQANGGWILNSSYSAFNLTLPTPGARGSIGFAKDITLNLYGQDTLPTPAPEYVSATNANATYTTAGQNMRVWVRWPTNYYVYALAQPYITLDMDGTDRNALCVTNLGTTPTNVLYFDYAIQTGDKSTNAAIAATRTLNYLTNGVVSGGVIWSNASGSGAAATNLPSFGGASALGQTKSIIVNVP
jgi:hypothetical protein